MALYYFIFMIYTLSKVFFTITHFHPSLEFTTNTIAYQRVATNLSQCNQTVQAVTDTNRHSSLLTKRV